MHPDEQYADLFEEQWYERKAAPKPAKPEDFDIKDACPNCHKEYRWDACQDCYWGAKEMEVTGEYSLRATLYLCECGKVFAASVYDDFGCDVFVPSTKEL